MSDIHTCLRCYEPISHDDEIEYGYCDLCQSVLLSESNQMIDWNDYFSLPNSSR